MNKNLDRGHDWRISDSSLYDLKCVNCGTTDTSVAADMPCSKRLAVMPDLGATVSAETQAALDAIEDNIRKARTKGSFLVG